MASQVSWPVGLPHTDIYLKTQPFLPGSAALRHQPKVGFPLKSCLDHPEIHLDLGGEDFNSWQSFG